MVSSGGGNQVKNVILSTNILPPYRVPLFNTLGRFLRERGYDFKVVFLAERESNRQWRVRKEELKVEHVLLPGWHYFLWRYEFPIHINPGIWKFLKKENPDVIIAGGYSIPAYWVGLLYCKVFKKKLILWTSTTPECVKGRDVIRRSLRAFFIRQADAFVTYGTRAADFLEQFGVDKGSVFIGCNVGDVEFFKKATAEYRKSHNFHKEKKKFSSPVLLFVGQLISRKGILQLLQALSGLKSRPWTLIAVGSGPLQGEIEKQLRKKNLQDRVHLVGFHEKEALAKFYALADIFVLPSLQEPYAIVVSEALASGLFTITSRYDGAAWDLIKPGENGLVVDPANIEELRLAIEKALDIASEPGFSREKIVHSIEQFTLERYAQAFVDAVNYVIKRPR